MEKDMFKMVTKENCWTEKFKFYALDVKIFL